MNFRKLINSLRVDHAKNLLISQKFKMIDVAYECGFTGDRTFYRAFGEITGMSPTEYRRLSLHETNRE
jgi:transcriptional regulator GlxA family with amidase domain